MILSSVALLLWGATARAQDTAVSGRCAIPDTIVFVGATRTGDAIRTTSGLEPGPMNYRTLQRAIKDIFATGQYDDVVASCELSNGKAALTITVKERPLLGAVDVTGTDRLSRNSVRDKVDLLVGKAVDPAQVAHAVKRIDSLYQASGYYLARVKPETTLVDGQINLLFRIDEGRRLAVSGVRVEGNETVSGKSVVGAMATKPEGFFWWRKGDLDNDKFNADVSEKIPGLFGSKGFIDAQVLHDTIMVDAERGKANIGIKVAEGPRYRVGSFEVTGNRHFSSEDIQRFYPFGDQPTTLTGAVKGLIRVGRGNDDKDYFDQTAWDDATRRVGEAYANEGYI